jgi:hypothetical protein
MKLSTALAVTLSAFSVVSVLANPASADVLKKGVHSCQNSSQASKMGLNKITCKASQFTNPVIKDGLEPNKIYSCKNAKILPTKVRRPDGEMQYNFTGKVKCD